MIYFDNAATTFPKPQSVLDAVQQAVKVYGGNPGRGGHAISLRAGEKVYAVREMAARFFGAQPENVIFTLNCTMALNMAIKGILLKGGHVITSSLEHNSVIRPIHSLCRNGLISYSVARVSEEDPYETVENFRREIRTDTKAVICTAASNLTGTLLPLRELGRLCREYGLIFLVDAAQAAGLVPIRMDEMGIDILCTAGHKGLYGTTGTGLLILRNGIQVDTILEGGTGSASLELEQPDFYPDRLESGTVNTVGVLSLGAGIKFLQKQTIQKIYCHEMQLCTHVWNELSRMPAVTLLEKNFRCGQKVPLLSFNVGDFPSAEIAEQLNRKGFALRGGFHCAALAHRACGTEKQGAVRFSPSFFNTQEQVRLFLAEMKKIQKYSGFKG